MKALFLFFASCLFSHAIFAQLEATPVCPPVMFDVLEGTINKLSPKATQGEILKTFPCATKVVEEDSIKCAGVFFEDKGISFFTDRDYIEIRSNYNGKTSIPLMGAARNSLFNVLGNPKMKDATWDAYQTQYGTLVVYFDKDNKINKAQFSNRAVGNMKVCQ